jgi:hypothetical protein
MRISLQSVNCRMSSTRIADHLDDPLSVLTTESRGH